ncbi:MAG TPA: hypothetical protein VH277_07320 [Gemmatimonadaceae bacterium]|jgi:hypothetical protein|nr:hypothetical protein [Gemmatimonadaceae bacterium]
MRRAGLTALASFAALALSYSFPAGVRAQSAPTPDYSPLEFLVGSCWVAAFPGGSATDTHCFEWMYGRHFIRDRHVVSSAPTYEGETVYGWNPLEKRIEWRYWSNDGMVMDGRVEPRGEDIVFPATYATPAAVAEIRAVWTRRGPDTYRAVQSQKTGDEWKTVLTVEYRRKAR